MKQGCSVFGIFLGVVLLCVTVFLGAHNINAPGAETAALKKDMTVSKIYEAGVKDIVFESPSGDHYYINRGLEQGFTLKELEQKLLNKSVTLRLTNKLAGVSRHIHQLQVDDEVIYSELN